MPSMRLDRTSEDNGCLHQLVLPALSWESLQMPVTPLPDAPSSVSLQFLPPNTSHCSVFHLLQL